MYGRRGPVAIDFQEGYATECVPGQGAAIANRDESADVESCLAIGETQELIRAAIGGLTRRHAAVLLARHFDGLTFDEIAEVFGVSRGAVHHMHTRACERLRESLALMGAERFSDFSF